MKGAEEPLLLGSHRKSALRHEVRECLKRDGLGTFPCVVLRAQRVVASCVVVGVKFCLCLCFRTNSSFAATKLQLTPLSFFLLFIFFTQKSFACPSPPVFALLCADKCPEYYKKFHVLICEKKQQKRRRVFLVVSLQTTKDVVVLVRTGGAGVVGWASLHWQASFFFLSHHFAFLFFYFQWPAS